MIHMSASDLDNLLVLFCLRCDTQNCKLIKQSFKKRRIQGRILIHGELPVSKGISGR